ncbi:MAG TPA: glycosyltransferase, partial [Candidatus Babeliales bacterium]|nr:glycosyltransferase [Candidatus Babeliales bacterium]
LFRDIYSCTCFSRVPEQNKYIIPKIIHQIWLGSSFPQKYNYFRKTWIDKHPNWTYILWTDHQENLLENTRVANSLTELQEFMHDNSIRIIIAHPSILCLFNQGYYNDSKNYGEKSDLLKWELIYQLGGVYVDTDFECIKPLDVGSLALGAALFGAVSGNEILKDCIETIKDDRGFSEVYVRTGPVHFTKSLMRAYTKALGVNAVFPPSFFYPLGARQTNLSRSEVEALFHPESYAVHWWEGAWVEKQIINENGSYHKIIEKKKKEKKKNKHKIKKR